MSKDNFKIIKDFGNPKKSERKKYLETMMARMGITSIDEIRSEDRSSFMKATKPSKETEKKLKGMGHSIHTDDNILSLGQRSDKIAVFYKLAFSDEVGVASRVEEVASEIGEIYGNKFEFLLFISRYLNINKKDYKSDHFENEVKNLFKRKLLDTNNIDNSLKELSGLFSEYSKILVKKEEQKEAEKIEREKQVSKTESPSKVESESGKMDKVKSINISDIPSDLSNIKLLSDRVDIENLQSITKKYLNILNYIAKENNKIIAITSAARTSRDQARIMLNNFNSKGGSDYLRRLYGKKIEPIVEIYNRTDSAENKIEAASKILDANPVSNHMRGLSLDLDLNIGKENIIKIVNETQAYATVNILDEGDHIHLDIKSLTPGGTFKRFARLNKYFGR